MIRIFVADTSSVTRSIEKDILNQNSRFMLCGDAASELEFTQKFENSKPDVLVADLELFYGKRIETVMYFLSKINIPTLLYVPEEFINFDAPEGVILLTKPSFTSLSANSMKEYSYVLEQMIDRTRKQLSYKVEKLNYEKMSQVVSSPNQSLRKKYKAVCIGVSTGGPGTIHQLLKSIGSTFPVPIYITQHIDSFFDKNLIVWLNANCSLPVHLARDNEIPLPGHVYFAPSEKHLVFSTMIDGSCVMKLNDDPPVNFLRPAVDKMFESAAQIFGENCVGVLLTGMGADGAKGCVKIKNIGGYTIAQDQESCVIYGMPKAAIDAGGASEVLPLDKIADRLKQLVGM